MKIKNSLLVFLCSGFLLAACQPQPVPAPAESPLGQAVTTMALISEPTPGQVIQSPLNISGNAPGSWFFEGQMQASLKTNDGKLLGQAPLTAQGEWMTDQPVPFNGKMTFTKPANQKSAILMIENDNPSGLPENKKSMQIQVLLK